MMLVVIIVAFAIVGGLISCMDPYTDGVLIFLGSCLGAIVGFFASLCALAIAYAAINPEITQEVTPIDAGSLAIANDYLTFETDGKLIVAEEIYPFTVDDGESRMVCTTENWNSVWVPNWASDFTECIIHNP